MVNTFFAGSNLEKCGKFWKNGRFSRRIWPDSGNTPRADMAGLGSKGLKILPSSHSTATWCIMVNVSMWCLPTTAQREWCARYYYMNDKENYTF